MSNQQERPVDIDDKSYSESKLVKLATNTTVERTEKKAIQLPVTLPTKAAIFALQKYLEQQEEIIDIKHTIPCHPLDGALVLGLALKEVYGYVSDRPSPFNGAKPSAHAVELPRGGSVAVLWGFFGAPGWTEKESVGCGFEEGKGGMPLFVVHGHVKRKRHAEIKQLALAIMAKLRTESLFRSRAFRIETDEDGDVNWFGGIEFMKLADVDRDQLIFSDQVSAEIETSLFTPVEHTVDVRRSGIPLKRGVLLSGKYGCGKTLTARTLARVSEDNGWTFIYCDKVQALEKVLPLAKLYGPTVIFAEDLERVCNLERDEATNGVLNTIDGIESKSDEILVVLTTNHLDQVNRAMLRPGRLDAVIEVTPPDAEACQRLVERYCYGLLEANADLTEVGRILAGQIPAIVREACERAKLHELHLRGKVDSLAGKVVITSAALEESSRAVVRQAELIEGLDGHGATDADKLYRSFGNVIAAHSGEAAAKQAKHLSAVAAGRAAQAQSESEEGNERLKAVLEKVDAMSEDLDNHRGVME